MKVSNANLIAQIFLRFPLVLVSIEKPSQTPKTVFDHISKLTSQDS